MGERRERGREVDRTCRHFVCWGGGSKKGAVHANRVFCRRRARCLHKEPADGSRWPTVTPEEMHPYNNDILPHKAPCVLVATHGHMSERRPSLYRPPASLSHFRPPSLTCSSVSPFTIEPFLFALCRRIFCRRFRICLRRGYLKTCHPRTGILVAHFRETGSGGRVIHDGGRSATSGCRGLPGKS